ncbi:MAG TPA: 2-oxo-tetronate isomerase [Stellaceae bacterium]|jgi:hydroxypyruvate isomerase|nr:2-oxo-tetronate isomerase [Stellaceae bacterium]
MPNFAANLSTLFTELPFLDRFAAARKAGFGAVEFQAPYDFPATDIAARAAAAGVPIVLFNAPMGNAKAGDRGFAAQPGREADFDASIATALDYARALDCRQIHVLAGLATGEERTRQEAVYVANLQRAAPRAAVQGVSLLIEPLNACDNPGYFLNTTRQAIAILDRVAQANVGLQFDFYHCQISEGDLAQHARDLSGRYPHVQIANVPGRHEPDQGEVDFAFLFDLLDKIGYGGWIGCEYRPKAGTLAGLGWGRRWGIGG